MSNKNKGNRTSKNPIVVPAQAAAVVNPAPEPTPAPVTNGHVAANDPDANALLLAEIAKLKAENATLMSKGTRKPSLKVSEKGGISVYGLGRFPVTLYQEQMLALLAMADEIKAFIIEKAAELKTKPQAS